MRHLFSIFAAILLAITALNAQSHIDLSGKWQLRLTESDTPVAAQLPGTTDQAQVGIKTSGSDFGILTRRYKHYGTALWERTVTIPESWAGKTLALDLERVMWESRLKVDGREVNSSERQDALSTPHRHLIAPLSPGEHTLTLAIDNDTIHNIGDKGHAYTEYTQTIWNGAVGKIRLTPLEPVRIDNPQIYATVEGGDKCMLRLVDTLINSSGKRMDITVEYSLTPRLDPSTTLWSASQTIKSADGCPIMIEAPMPANVLPWSDTSPEMYNLTVTLKDKRGTLLDRLTIETGFRTITHSNSKILVNGRPVFLRGNLDGVQFPLTGYPSCEVGDWERIFRIYKDYGLNHVRFHSWCPPQAAFTAANRIGIYIQAETIWIDWWMTTTPADRPEMYTKGLPKGLGHNPSADAFIPRELQRMVSHYGNNPSFVMMCIGNELGNSDFDTLASWIEPIKARDNRRLYSLSSARRVTPTDQYMATHHVDGIGATRGLAGGPSTDWDFEANYSRMKIPTIAHEIGQWPVYPRWDEICKYSGVVEARNFEEFRTTARKNNIENQNSEFVAASGALSQIMYKYEIESFLRTPSCAGIQLLSMQDYQGQGEALIGWLDTFWDSKGITTPERFRRHHDTIVPLLRLPKFVWRTDEPLRARIQLANYGTATLSDSLWWSVRNSNGVTIASGVVPQREYAIGSSVITDSIEVALAKVTKADKLTIEVGLHSRPISNSWSVWAYPSICAAPVSSKKTTVAGSTQKPIFITDKFDAECRARLDGGERVLLLASKLGLDENSYDAISYYPLYWSLTFFPGQGINTLGMVVRDKHPALAHFPTDSHSDWQWQSIYKGSRGFLINDFPADFRPIAQPVDDFHRNNKLGAIMEMKVGRGRLMVCGFDISETAAEKLPVARQLRESLVRYMNSDEFAPVTDISPERLSTLFASADTAQEGMPTEFTNALLYIDCAENFTKENISQPWSAELDKVVAKRGVSYRVQCDGVWRDDISRAWHGRDIQMEINPPQGMIGTLYVYFHDWNGQKRSGNIRFEGRDYALGEHDGEGRWVKLHVMREDSNDGKLLLKATAKSGGNLMISRVVLVAE